MSKEMREFVEYMKIGVAKSLMLSHTGSVY